MEIVVSEVELLEKKLALILRIRDMTEAADLSKGNIEENYITLIARREAIISKLKAIDLKLKEATLEEEGSGVLLNRISEISQQVIDLDEQIAKQTPEMLKGIKKRIKQLKNGKNINEAYNGTITQGFYKQSR